MRDFSSIALFTLVVSLLYTGVAQFLPQLENHPPARLNELPSDVGPKWTGLVLTRPRSPMDPAGSR